MRVVIQCAGQKDPAAGSFLTSDGRRVSIVAHPEELQPETGRVYSRPDDESDDGRTWRDRLLSYNRDPGANPYGLLPAYKLYRNDVYRGLHAHLGSAGLFILSAGWGLIPADFLTPDYDITFSGSAAPPARRRKRDRFDDWAMIEARSESPLIFLGGKDYLPYFAKLTRHYEGPRIALYNSLREPRLDGVQFVRYETATRTNWHYEAAKALLEGRLSLSV